MKIRLLVSAVAFAAVAAVAAGCGEKRQEVEAPVSVPLNVNLIENPSFETWNGTVPMGWKLEFIEGGGKQPNMYGQSSEEKRSGSYSFYLRGFYNVDKWIALTQRHPVIPGHRLRYGGEMKSKDIKKNRGQEARANIYIRFFDRDGKRVDESRWADGQTRYLLGTTDWRKRGRSRMCVQLIKREDLAYLHYLNSRNCYFRIGSEAALSLSARLTTGSRQKVELIHGQ